jgi:hypothetical protein
VFAWIDESLREWRDCVSSADQRIAARPRQPENRESVLKDMPSALNTLASLSSGTREVSQHLHQNVRLPRRANHTFVMLRDEPVPLYAQYDYWSQTGRPKVAVWMQRRLWERYYETAECREPRRAGSVNLGSALATNRCHYSGPAV